ncbi:hypothetical protein G6F56_004069 [Rhizopus delemar]|uniref:Uncharacterized protein n=1 Tax=Rhizopus stolonifer TaxID=4846 RepID=A0A367J009_RHIST|nr:hypothetical protein G6F56_004069 [Rhizopus delemar]RCH83267.1 hypothetical protein CU098_009134 [Rhizopus stolonifer]
MELVMTQLQEKQAELGTHYAYLGKGFEKTIRPWALVFCKDMEPLETALHQTEAEQRMWLDMIRICRVETAHQLRAVLCGIHIQPKDEAEHVDILRWIEKEKNGQPPSVIVVADMFDFLLRNTGNTESLRYLTIK